MMSKPFFAASLTFIAAVIATTLWGPAPEVPSASAGGEDRIVAIRGSMQEDGKAVLVEILVVAQGDEDAEQQARHALHDLHPDAEELVLEDITEGQILGAPSPQYTVNGIVWDTLPVTVNYNGAGAPVGGALDAFLTALQTWTDVPASSFAFAYGGTTSRCPSLYDACPGTFDGYNDLGWADIPSTNVLGIAYYGSFIDETDIIIDNATFVWYTGNLPVLPGSYDLQTVILHELGHGAGLGHSSDPNAVMYPQVPAGQARRVPNQDDVAGISYLYPSGSGTPTSTPTPPPTSTPTSVPTSTPTPVPTSTPTIAPSSTPTPQPTSTPTPQPTSTPPAAPTTTPTPQPTSTPTSVPSSTPTQQPTSTPPAAPTNTPPTPGVTPKDPVGDTDGDTIPNDLDPNDDNDSCTDAQELGMNPYLGGQRNPHSFWDFFDVPAGPQLTRDGSIGSMDIFAILARFNSTDAGPGDFDRNDDPLSTPNPLTPGANRANYHPAYDRGSVIGRHTWDLGPPDGSITSLEMFGILAQFGHSCS